MFVEEEKREREVVTWAAAARAAELLQSLFISLFQYRKKKGTDVSSCVIHNNINSNFFCYYLPIFLCAVMMHWLEPPGFAERSQKRFDDLLPAALTGVTPLQSFEQKILRHSAPMNEIALLVLIVIILAQEDDALAVATTAELLLLRRRS